MEKMFSDQASHIEVIFEFIGTRKNPAADEYRLMQLITGNDLSTGIHYD